MSLRAKREVMLTNYLDYLQLYFVAFKVIAIEEALEENQHCE